MIPRVELPWKGTELYGVVTQVIPHDKLDQYIIPEEIRDAVEPGEDLVTLLTSDPYPRRRQLLESPIGRIVRTPFLLIPPVRDRVDEWTGESVHVAVPERELREGDRVFAYCDARSYRVIDGERDVDLWAADTSVETGTSFKVLRNTIDLDGIVERFDGPSEEQRQRQEKYREKLDEDGEDR